MPQCTTRVTEYHVRHLELIVEIHPKDHSLQGTVTNYLSPFRDGLAAVVLDGANLKIATCRIQGTKCKFTHNADKLTITPLIPLARAREVAVEVTYTMPGGLTEGGERTGRLPLDDSDPQYPERVPEFWTQGETETNRNWVPCYDYPNDKCTSEIVVTVPQNWETIGNGIKGEVKRRSGPPYPDLYLDHEATAFDLPALAAGRRWISAPHPGRA